ncbi:MAG: 1-(5-phosphoribosyl)-5-[(5-phosphoribosylamino)methylideneamino]imidazole-4-carboxamide isomerase [Bacteroidaceae bacterium]|nr:1-(5-phosphoribosyl)-5-[(5-phosphoribosylamino)methylideneamino]imidazole-4-carboxamide isomerase [Bacteroidaceae bacterium]
MIEIIPAIDLIDGKCVRLTKGDYNQKKVYNDNPLEVAKQYEDAGVKRLHLVDLDGARSKHVVNIKTVEAIASQTKLVIDFGGGVKTDDDIKKVFNAGAAMITAGSIAVTNKEQTLNWIKTFGADRIILGADVKNGYISINGWKEEGQDLLLPFIKYYTEQGITNVLCTDISKDGMLQGPAVELYKEILKEHPTLNLIASGGVSSMQDIYDLDKANVKQVVVGKAIYEGRITLEDIKDCNKL